MPETQALASCCVLARDARERDGEAMQKQIFVLLATAGLCGPATAQNVLFDFDSAPAHTPLPIDLTVGGITAHFSAAGQGFSIQAADTMGFTPVGFAGNCIYPSSVYAADLLVGFSRKLTDFSILYAPQELACDSSATMRVTAYMSGALVGTNTKVADPPGTWPTATLSISLPSGFNSVVVHYYLPPPTGGDWGPIFMADNMNVTPAPFVPPPGDYDANGIVELADYVVWQKGFGAAVTPGSGPDGNGNGVVDAADYTVWRDHLGAVAGAASGSAVGVPEPATALLGWMGLLLVYHFGRWYRNE
jgi:hypothetical protein